MQNQARATKHSKFVAVAGNIGVGKSTFVSLYAKTRGGLAVYEPADENPFLDDFYRDMPRWGFATQMCFLTHRVRQLVALSTDEGLIVQDRSLDEDCEIFACNLHRQGYMDDREWDTYQKLFACLAHNVVRKPDLIVYLKASLSTLQGRIAKRGRPFERMIEPRYLEGLNQLYDAWMARLAVSRVLVIDADRRDFVADAEYFAEIAAQVDAALS